MRPENAEALVAERKELARLQASLTLTLDEQQRVHELRVRLEDLVARSRAEVARLEAP